jgi:hypothetical protein
MLLPVSLQREAQRAYRQLSRSGPLAGRIVDVAERLQTIPSLARASAFPFMVIAAVIGGLFVPCPVHWSALSDAKNATTFLAEEWAVTAGSLGFSVVLIVFAYQTVANTRQVAGLRDLSMVTPLLLVLYLGIAAVLVDGLALLGVGYQAPAMWAASWATCVSGLAVTLLAFLIAASLRAVDPQVLQRRRVELLRRSAARAIRVDAVQRIALNILIADGDQSGYEVSPLESGGPARQHSESVLAIKTGAIMDVRLDRLRRVAGECAGMGVRSPVITVVPPRAIGDGTRLAFVPSELGDTSRRRLASAFRMTRRTQSDAHSLLVAAADELHQEAMQAIETGRTLAFQEACIAQEELLLAFPEAWSRLGQSFTADLASGMFPLTSGPLDPLGRHLYEQAMKAIHHRDREIADLAVGLPLTVAARALPLGAHALTDRMLQILSSVASGTRGAAQGSLDAQEHFSTLSHVTSYIGYLVFPRIENDDLDMASRLKAVEFLSESASVLIDMMKDAVESADLGFFDEAVRRWREFGELWLEDHELGGIPAGTEDLGQMARIALDRMRFALCSWLIRRLWHDPGNSALSHAFTSVAWFDSVQRLFDLAEMPLEDPASRRLSNWILSALPEGQAHAIDTVTPSLRAVVTLTLRLGVPPGLQLRPSRWIRDNASATQDVVAEVEAASDLLSAVGISDITPAAATLRATVTDAAAEQEKLLEEQLIDASVDEVRVEAFAAAVRGSWEKRRTAARLLRNVGASEDVDSDIFDSRYGYRRYAPKGWFVDDGVAGVEGYANQIGYRMADGENARLYDAIKMSSAFRRKAGDINLRLDHAIESMRAGGYRPTTVFVSWRTWEVPADFLVQPVQGAGNSADMVRGELSTFRGLNVIEVRGLSSDRVILADLKAFATWRQRSIAGEALAVSVAGIDEDAAIVAVREDRKLMKEPGRTKSADRARELRKYVIVEACEDFVLQINDSRAARAVMLPPKSTRH